MESDDHSAVNLRGRSNYFSQPNISCNCIYSSVSFPSYVPQFVAAVFFLQGLPFDWHDPIRRLSGKTLLLLPWRPFPYLLPKTPSITPEYWQSLKWKLDCRPIKSKVTFKDKILKETEMDKYWGMLCICIIKWVSDWLLFVARCERWRAISYPCIQELRNITLILTIPVNYPVKNEMNSLRFITSSN